MAIFKCKMCGGSIEFEQGATVGVCDSCGTKQTLPRLDDERRVNLYDRANHFRRNNEYDKASGIYEQILNEDTSDAEAYWSLVLCRYGIEYVEDPASHKIVPTVNRAQFTSVFDDANYKSALNYADSNQRIIYEEEANAINEIQKGILAISQKEDPFDVFICYKETDQSGRRTPDSVLATELYYQLKQEGFKVFFSRITLEDKLGSAYEPYIFAALNSAKVMVVIGTKPEFLNSPWVKNEWSRYLTLVRESGGKKTLIPAYRDMDPYDLPEEFSHLQAQDMSKLGFMQDLIRGIKKITDANEPNSVVKETIVNSGNAKVEPLLKRVFLFLEDGEWEKADAFCEQVLNQEPENAQAYIGKLMAELQVRRQNDLANCERSFETNNNYQKALRFGDEKTKSTLNEYIAQINERIKYKRLNEIYDVASAALNSADSEDKFLAISRTFNSISGFRDSSSLAQKCIERAEVCRKNEVYANAINRMNENTVNGYEAAIGIFNTISGWKDSYDKIVTCQNRINEIKLREEAERLERARKEEERRLAALRKAKRIKNFVIFALIALVICTIAVILLNTVIIPEYHYSKAMKLVNEGDYISAHDMLIEMNYKDSKDVLDLIEPQYKKALLAKAKTGSTIYFGSYEQDNDHSNGKEEIEWIVVENNGKQIFLVSKYLLDSKQFNETYTTDVTWETCSLRKWLNSEFLNDAFDKDEIKMILSYPVSCDDSNSLVSEYLTNDQVFLLSETELNKYFQSEDERVCIPTKYASLQLPREMLIQNGSYISSKWWLRTSRISRTGGGDSCKIAEVNAYGSVEFEIGANRERGIRPAMWIDLDAE